MERLARQRYLATPRAKELNRLKYQRHRERAKHLRKFLRSDKEPAKRIRIEASSQDIDREPSSEPISFTAPTGVPGKIFWAFRSLTWELCVVAPRVQLVHYLREQNLTLSIAEDLNGDEFEKAK